MSSPQSPEQIAEQPVLLEHPAEGVALVRFNRPRVRNALNLVVRKELARIFSELSADDSVRAIILTGSDAVFCAGADLREYADATTIEIFQRDASNLWRAIADCPKPVISAVNGFALGGGCELAMQTDIIVAGEGARFGQPEVKVGLIPGAGATQRLTRAVGKYKAMQMLLLGDFISAAEALAAGLVSKVVPDSEVASEALKMAVALAALPPIGLRQIKELALASMNNSLDAGLQLERKAFQITFSSQDKSEGIKAFLEKRKPEFKGC